MLVKVDPFRSPGPPYLKATVDEAFAGQDGQEGGGTSCFATYVGVCFPQKLKLSELMVGHSHSLKLCVTELIMS